MSTDDHEASDLTTDKEENLPIESKNCETYVDHETAEFVTKEKSMRYERCNGTLYAIEEEVTTRQPLNDVPLMNQERNTTIVQAANIGPTFPLNQPSHLTKTSNKTWMSSSAIKPNVCVKLSPAPLCTPACPPPCVPRLCCRPPLCGVSRPIPSAAARLCRRPCALRPRGLRQLENGLCRVRQGIDAVARSLDDTMLAVNNLTPDY